MEFENLAELSNMSMRFDDAEYRDVHVNKELFAEGYRCIWNTTQNKLVAIKKVKNRALILHRDLVDEFIQTSLDLNLKLKGSITETGNTMTLVAFFKDYDCSDDVKPGIYIQNSYKSNTTKVGLYGFRTSCANSMVLTSIFRKTVKVNKIDDLNGALRTCINTIMNENARINSIIESAMKDSIEWHHAKNILQLLIKTQKHRDNIINILEESLKDGEISRWDIYNAITNYATNGGSISVFLENRLQNAAQKVLIETKFNAVKSKINIIDS